MTMTTIVINKGQTVIEENFIPYSLNGRKGLFEFLGSQSELSVRSQVCTMKRLQKKIEALGFEFSDIDHGDEEASFFHAIIKKS